MRPSKDVTVIGAGVVGLATAVELAERGAKVTLIERSPALGGDAASWLAGGMLAPYCEGESAPPSVVQRGVKAIDWWSRRVPGVAREGTLVVAPPRDVGEIDRFAALTREYARVDEAHIAALEPDLAGRFSRGLFFPGEGYVDPRLAMRALRDHLVARAAEIQFGVDGETAKTCGVVIDCRGFAARSDLAELRGVRGEMMIVRTR
ncbi:MAG TPA: FAD-dependent oxidoreductase, partial [Roseiarcus sp.]